MEQIVIIWLDAMEEAIKKSYTGDEFTHENVAELEQYINSTTEGLDAPEEWDQFDLVGEEVA